MREFGGAEPLVGAVVAVRTFRVDDSGLLLPLYSTGVWYDGTNTAVCAPPTGRHARAPHAAPADECECGFYGYGSREAVRHNRHSRYVQAVVSCWGGVVAGTLGIRAQHARIDALWLAADAPTWLRSRVAQRYPSARLYADVDAMLAEHPLSQLSCYEPPAPRRSRSAAAWATPLAVVLSLGLLPISTLHAHPVLWWTWLAATASTAALVGWLALRMQNAGHLAAAFVLAGVLGWLVAPLFGVAGWLLRLPLLRGLAVAAGGVLIALVPHHFPVVRTPRSTALSGVPSPGP